MTDTAHPPIRHQQLIVTIFGLYSRDTGHALPVSVLIDMLGDLGYDAPGVRSAVSRLKAKGILKSVKANNVAKYEVSGTVSEIFREGDELIFTPTGTRAGPDGTPSTQTWVLAIFSVPESMRNRRHQLRTVLAGFGFGSMASGVWIAPFSALERTKKRLAALELDQFVDFFHGDHVAGGDMRAKVAQWWDLAVLDEQFSEFLSLYGDAAAHWTERLGDDPIAALADSNVDLCRDAFRYYLPMLTIWRRFPYQDPNLAPEYLPKDWRGPAARAAFLEVHRLIAPLAAAHAQRLMA
ncbi:PaaX family transcriptional regulator [Arthrobacter sp. TMN-49]